MHTRSCTHTTRGRRACTDTARTGAPPPRGLGSENTLHHDRVSALKARSPTPPPSHHTHAQVASCARASERGERVRSVLPHAAHPAERAPRRRLGAPRVHQGTPPHFATPLLQSPGTPRVCRERKGGGGGGERTTQPGRCTVIRARQGRALVHATANAARPCTLHMPACTRAHTHVRRGGRGADASRHRASQAGGLPPCPRHRRPTATGILLPPSRVSSEHA